MLHYGHVHMSSREAFDIRDKRMQATFFSPSPCVYIPLVVVHHPGR